MTGIVEPDGPARRAAEIEIGGRFVGPGQPVLVIAEIGINHNGDIGLALESIDAAAEAGADAVKFQNYRTEDFISDRSLTYTYTSQDKTITESQFDMFKRCELRPEILGELKQQCDNRGILFSSTPTSERGVADLVAIGTPVLKNGSDYLSNLPLIRAMGETGLPTILSTGMAAIADIEAAVAAFRETGNPSLILLVCTSMYPTPAADAHVARVATLAASFGCLVGFSDHTEGVGAAISATCFGGCVLEKHFTLDRNLPGPDHRFSVDPEGLRRLVLGVREGEAAIGSGRLGYVPGEAEARQGYRLSCVAAQSLPEGYVLATSDIAFRRPGSGLAPGLADTLVGRPLRRAVPAGHVFDLSDLD